MKKLTVLFSTIIMCITICSCSTAPAPLTEADLTEQDYKYIDCVYNLMDQWDTTHYDSGEDHNINKIAFYDFAYEGKISFYKNYPVAGYCGSGYYVHDNTMEFIEFSVYDVDSERWHDGNLMNTSVSGTDWNSSATDEQKYETLKTAYLAYLEDVRESED